MLNKKDTAILARRFKTDADRRPTTEQHRKPCADCPWARKAIPGWLGSHDAPEWVRMVHGEDLIDCHLTTNRECAGAAIYRANVRKSLRDSSRFKLARDAKTVFETDAEFLAHHFKEDFDESRAGVGDGE